MVYGIFIPSFCDHWKVACQSPLAERTTWIFLPRPTFAKARNHRATGRLGHRGPGSYQALGIVSSGRSRLIPAYDLRVVRQRRGWWQHVPRMFAFTGNRKGCLSNRSKMFKQGPTLKGTSSLEVFLFIVVVLCSSATSVLAST